MNTQLNSDFYETVKERIRGVVQNDDGSLKSLSLLDHDALSELFSRMQKLIERGASVNYHKESDFNRTPLHCAAIVGYLPQVQFLKDHGGDVEEGDSQLQTPLILASMEGHLDVVLYLVKEGVKIDEVDKFGCTALIRACLRGHLEIVKFLVENGANIESVSYAVGATPLLEAAYWGHFPIVKYLVSKGSNIEARDADGRTSLYRAATIAHRPIIEFLKSCGADINAKSHQNETPLHRAALHGHLSVIKFLIDHGADLAAKNNEEKTPIDVAATSNKIDENKRRQIIKLLKGKLNETTYLELQKYETELPKDPSGIGLISNTDPEEFQQLLSRGFFKSYENRLYLAGPCNVGKTTLASLLLGRKIPQDWESTNGLEIYFGRNGIHLKDRKMIPLSGDQDVYSKVIRGHPTVQKSLGGVEDSENEDMNWTDLETDAIRVQNTVTDIKTQPKNLIESTVLYTGNENTSLPPGSLTGRCTNLRTRHRSSPRLITPSKIHEEILQQIRQGKYKLEVVPSDIVDFGGQKAFDMTHQFFIQHRGVIVLMFNGSKHMNENLKEYSHESVTTISILHHWINSILTYCTESDDGMPQIVFVATHSDKVKTSIYRRRKLLIDELDRQFGHHEKSKHLNYKQLFFINTTDKNDSELDRLKNTLVELAESQSTWGEHLPMIWVPLLLQLDDMRNQGANIIKRNQINEINSGNGDLALTKNQLEKFLHYQHSTGKVIYFDEPGLREFITIQPSALVNILRSIITDEMFWPEEHQNIFRNLEVTGKLKKSDLLKIWSDKKYDNDMPTDDFKNFVIELLIRLDILIEPRIFENCEVELHDYYFVPCMVRSTNLTNDLKLIVENRTNESDGDEKLCLLYNLGLPFIPPTLSFRLIGTAVSTWPIKQQDGQACLFYNSAVLNIDENSDLLIRVDDQKIIIYFLNNSKHVISKDITASIQECITSALTKISAFYHKAFKITKPIKNINSLFQIEAGVLCGNEPCYITETEVKVKKEWICKRKRKHQTEFPRYWFFDKTHIGCPEYCTGFIQSEMDKRPTDKQLIRFTQNFGYGKFKIFAVNLGLKQHEIENIELDYKEHGINSVMFMILQKWKTRVKYPVFTDLLRALVSSGEDPHKLCSATREKTEFFRISREYRRQLQKVPEEKLLQDISTKMGNCAMHLGIELGLSVPVLENIWLESRRNHYKISEIIHRVLKKWTQSFPIKPTAFRLMLALDYVESGGLDFLVENYLKIALKDLYQADTK